MEKIKYRTINFFRELFTLKNNKYIYFFKLWFILLRYRKILCKTPMSEPVEDMMHTRSLKIIFLSSFKELLSLRDKYSVNINYQKLSRKDTIFYFLNNHKAYIFVLSVTDEFYRFKGTDFIYDEEDMVEVLDDNVKEIELLDVPFTLKHDEIELLDELSNDEECEILDDIFDIEILDFENKKFNLSEVPFLEECEVLDDVLEFEEFEFNDEVEILDEIDEIL